MATKVLGSHMSTTSPMTSRKEYKMKEHSGITPATPETSMGRFFRQYPDKQSTPLNTNIVSIAKPGPRKDVTTRNHPPSSPVTNQVTRNSTTTTTPPPTLDGPPTTATLGDYHPTPQNVDAVTTARPPPTTY